MNFIDRQVFTRVSCVLKLPETILDAANTVASTSRAIVCTTLAVAVFGRSNVLNQNIEDLDEIRYLFSDLIRGTIRILNPDANLSHERKGICTTAYTNGYLKPADDGSDVEDNELNEADAPFSRGDLIKAALATTVTKVIDVALGLIALPFVYLSFGYFDKLNAFAITQLTEVDVISLPFITAYGLMQPNDQTVKSFFS